MKQIEYNTIRKEILQLFTFTEKVIFFSIAAIGAIYSWLATQVFIGTMIFNDAFFFIMIGLAIITYGIYKYLDTYRLIYRQGGYLLAFHEISKIELSKNEDGIEKYKNVKLKGDLNWYIISRHFNEIIGKAEKRLSWGPENKRAAILYLFLVTIVWLGPLYLMGAISPIFTLNYLTNRIGTLIVCILSTFIALYLIKQTFCLKNFMQNNLSQWCVIKAKYDETDDHNVVLTKDFKDLFNKALRKYNKHHPKENIERN